MRERLQGRERRKKSRKKISLLLVEETTSFWHSEDQRVDPQPDLRSTQSDPFLVEDLRIDLWSDPRPVHST